MFKIWGRIVKDNKFIKDYTACIDDNSLTRTKKVYKSLEIICHELDLSVPIWLPINKNDFIMHSKTRFKQDNFIEEIEFDYLDFQLIEEDF